jgi:hypothetical protein
VVIVVIVVIVTMAMEDHNLVVVLLVTVTMMNLDNLVVIIVTIVMTNLDDFAMMVPISIPVLVADADGYAAFSDHYRLVDCGRPGQRRSAQDCKRARDKYQFVHVTFLHEVMLPSLRRRETLLSFGCALRDEESPESGG